MANTVVVGVMCAMLLFTIGVGIFLFDTDKAKQLFLSGGVLAGVMVAVSTLQLGAVPVTFDAVRAIGLYSVPDGWFTATYNSITGWVLGIAAWLGSALFALGIALMIAKQSYGGKLLILGAIMATIAGLVGGGGIVGLIGNLIGIDVVVLA